MFSVVQKRAIAEEIQRILRKTNHPELPSGEIQFTLHVDGAESWSWADIRNNGAVANPGVNPWNEMVSHASARCEVTPNDTNKIAEQCAERLFVNGFGDTALRLKLIDIHGRDLGGWCKQAVVGQIAEVLCRVEVPAPEPDVCRWRKVPLIRMWQTACDSQWPGGPARLECPGCGRRVEVVG